MGSGGSLCERSKGGSEEVELSELIRVDYDELTRSPQEAHLATTSDVVTSLPKTVDVYEGGSRTSVGCRDVPARELARPRPTLRARSPTSELARAAL